MRIDLHTHSAYSDGTQTPRDLLLEARDEGLDVVALTDHDTVAGWEEAMSAGEELGIRVIRGIEVTAKTATGISVHLLAYLPNPESPELTSVLAAARDSRDLRAQRMVELIGADYALDWEDVLAAAGEGSTIGRPHIADALIARGHVGSREEAFAGILHGGSPYFVSHASPSPEEAVRIVRRAGGVPVFAHPRARARGRVVGEETFAAMVEAGLAGLEIEHRDNPLEERGWLRDYAARHDLIVTGSSDFHGRGKPNTLGENTTTSEMFERILAEVRSGLS